MKRLLCSMKLCETYTYECFQTKLNEEVDEEIDEEVDEEPPAEAFHQPLVVLQWKNAGIVWLMLSIYHFLEMRQYIGF
ncbi:hypothetical protein ACN9MH_22110 [Paenibacillus silvae]|uniref:hypothetical protein n=1 Tax=Paenibacillus silvae TaxID=1325358 RepID=UPI003CFA2D1E